MPQTHRRPNLHAALVSSGQVDLAWTVLLSIIAITQLATPSKPASTSVAADFAEIAEAVEAPPSDGRPPDDRVADAIVVLTEEGLGAVTLSDGRTLSIEEVAREAPPIEHLVVVTRGPRFDGRELQRLVSLSSKTGVQLAWLAAESHELKAPLSSQGEAVEPELQQAGEAKIEPAESAMRRSPPTALRDSR